MARHSVRRLLGVSLCVALGFAVAAITASSDEVSASIADLVEERSTEITRRYRPWRVSPDPWPYAEQRFYYLKGRRVVVFSPGAPPKTQKMDDETVRTVKQTLTALANSTGSP